MKTIKKFLFIMIVSLFAVVVIPTKAATKESAKDQTGTSEFIPENPNVEDIYGM